jgi:hypothetical protein
LPSKLEAKTAAFIYKRRKLRNGLKAEFLKSILRMFPEK